MAEQLTENLWSVILSGGRNYLGVIRESPNANGYVTLQPCYEITVQLIPVGRGENGMPIISKNISAEPVLLGFEESPVLLIPTGIVGYDTMKEGDRRRYKRLAEDAAKMCLNARAAESGITMPGGRGA